jgi:hypothetical protein
MQTEFPSSPHRSALSSHLIPSAQSNRVTRPQQRLARTKLYGYVLTEEWFMDYAVKHQLGGPSHSNDAAFNVLNKILPAAGLTKVYSVKWDGNPPVCKALAVAVGHRKRSGELKMASKERIEKVKEVLGEDSDPAWYEMY